MQQVWRQGKAPSPLLAALKAQVLNVSIIVPFDSGAFVCVRWDIYTKSEGKKPLITLLSCLRSIKQVLFFFFAGFKAAKIGVALPVKLTSRSLVLT